VHGEHGWDVGDIDGANRSNRFTRRIYRPFVSHYVALSRHIEEYLRHKVGIRPDAITQIYNGVDVQRFSMTSADRRPINGSPFNDAGLWLVGTVGRLVAVKDQAALIRSLARLHRASSVARERMRLAIVGEGPLNSDLRQLALGEGVAESVWLPGARSDIAEVMAGFNVFALPSLAEGISNTLLEAMSSGRAVVATDVGGNAELIADEVSGRLVPPRHAARLDAALLGYFENPASARKHGLAAREAVEAQFSLDRMTADYAAVYERVASRNASAPSTDAASLEPRRYH
jgi:sugar transferase (PEP-CTERM/EpsH1 system associated)